MIAVSAVQASFTDKRLVVAVHANSRSARLDALLAPWGLVRRGVSKDTWTSEPTVHAQAVADGVYTDLAKVFGDVERRGGNRSGLLHNRDDAFRLAAGDSR